MKFKYKLIDRNEAIKWITISNCFAKSLYPYQKAVSQFNALSATERIEIQNMVSKHDEIRRKNIPAGESDETYFDSVLVDMHIIATEFDIDPLTVAMCVQPPCKANEKIVIR